MGAKERDETQIGIHPKVAGTMTIHGYIVSKTKVWIPSNHEVGTHHFIYITSALDFSCLSTA